MKPTDMPKAEKAEEKAEEAAPVAAPVAAEVIDFSKVKVEPLFTDFVDFDTFAKSDFRVVKVKACVAITNLPPRKMMGIDSEGMLISAVHEEDGHEGLNLLMLDSHIPAGAKLY